MKKKITVSLMVLTVLFLFIVGITQQKGAIATTQDNYILEPIVQNKTFYIPLNSIENIIDAKSQWIIKDQQKETLFDNNKIILEANKSTANVNGLTVNLNAPVTFKGNNLLIPLQFAEDYFPVDIKWDNSNNKLNISKRAYQPNGVEQRTILGKKVNLIPYQLTSSQEYFWGSQPINAPTDKEFAIEKDNLIKKYLSSQSESDNTIKEKFSPYNWLQDISTVCLYAEKNNKVQELTPLITDQMDYIKKHIKYFSDASYVEYDFSNSILNKEFKDPWYSDLGNAMVIKGVLEAYSVTGNKEYMEIVDKLVNAFFQFRTSSQQSTPWISFIDNNGFLWFEECPSKDDPQLRVLNGDIFGIEGLYAYYLYKPNDDLLNLIRANITTIKTYLNDYRVPNGIHKYALYYGSTPDYGQIRNLNQLEFLYNITGDSYFMYMRSEFNKDYANSGKKIQ